jgi:hypothetical protein
MITPFLRLLFSLFWFCLRLVEGGVRWLISCITSSAVAFYPDCLTSPSLSSAFLLPAAVALTFRPQPSRPYSHCWIPLACSGRGLGRRVTLALLSFTTPGKCDAEPGIGRPMAKIPRDDRVRVLPCYALETHDASIPGSEQAIGAWRDRERLRGPGWAPS